MAKKTDSTVDDPDLLEDGGQFIPEYRPPDYEVIGADGGLFGGGLGTPTGNLADVLRTDIEYAPGYYPGRGIFIGADEAERLGVDQGNIFLSNPNLLNAPSLTGAVPGISPGGPAVGGGPTPIDVKTKSGTTITSEELSQKIVDRVAQREAQAGVKLSDAQLNSVVEDVMDEIYGPVASGGVNRPLATGQGGIPLVIPIPGLDPTSAAILTAAGLIFSGGKIARLNPNDLLGSVVQAGQGVVQTGQNVVNVVTGQDTLENIWSAGTTPSTGTPASGQQTAGAGAAAVIGGMTGGGSSVSGAGASGQQSTGGGAVGVSPGALGGTTGQAAAGTGKPSGGEQPPQTGGPYIYDSAERTQNILAQILAPSQAINQAAAAAASEQQQKNVINQTLSSGAAAQAAATTGGGAGGDVGGGATNVGVIGTGTGTGTTGTGTTGTGATGTGTGTGGSGGGGDTGGGGGTPTVTGTGGGGGGAGTGTGGSGTGTAGGDTATSTGGPGFAGTGGGGGGTGGPSGGPTASTTIFTPMPAFTFTKTTPGEVAMRDFEKEFGLTSSTLMGKPGQDLANFYQQLQSQFTPSTLTQLAGTSQQQLMSDLDRLAMAQRGQLSPEDVRSAQQSAREAYAARGQVMAPGAIGAEILNRDVLRRQREAEARANVQQSMANLGAAAQLQTGNIFAPFANLLAKTYGPTSEYANAVYDYNVNAYNAYQAAQENLAAYKEAAAKGEQAQFINTFANFLANNGIQTTQNALAKFFQALLPKG